MQDPSGHASAWHELDQDTYQAAWDAFEREFCFRPSVREEDWPGIREPEDSITFSIGHVYGDPDRYVRLTNDLGCKLIEAFRRCVEAGSTIFVFDWQHPCYSFAPHQAFEFESEDDWPVPALPNGDYYIFTARDMRFGVFGHPWEQTMCVWGRDLMAAFRAAPPLLFDRKIREGGKVS